MMILDGFFNRDAKEVARDLLGKIIKRWHKGLWLSAMIIETEAYYKHESVAHSFKGITKGNAAMFMKPGTIYMYYSYGKDSLNISCLGDGNAVLIKSCIPYTTEEKVLQCMQELNPKCCGSLREVSRLCSGQTLLCKALNLKVEDWNKKSFDVNKFYIKSNSYAPTNIISTSRLGIYGKEADLHLRFIDENYIKYCTKMPKGILKKN